MPDVAAQVPPPADDVDAAGEAEEEEPAFDHGAKKKKKKKKPAAAAAAAAAAANGAAPPLDAVADLAANAEPMDLADAAEAQAAAEAAAAASAEAPIEFPTADFGPGKKKKKKKAVAFDDDDDADDLDGRGETGENGERLSRRVVAPQPWDGSDRDYTYEELLARALEFLHGKNPSLRGGGSGGAGRKKIALQFPQVARDGTKKTVFLNFGAIAKLIHRQQDHLLAYLCAELGTSGNVQDAGRLVIKGRFTAEGIANVLKKYMMDYVVCQSCLSPDTVLMRDANTRLYFVSCESCGAHRSVANISAGYVARVTRRKKAG